MGAAPDSRSAFGAQILLASAEGLAGLTASRLLEREPDLAQRHGAGAFEAWRQHVRAQVAALAAAASDGDLEGFARQAAWSRTAFESRDVPAHDLVLGLRTLLDVVETELPPRAAEGLRPLLERAIARATAPEARERGLSAETPEGELALRVIEALLSGDADAAWGRVRAALDAGRAPTWVLYEVLPRVQRETGRLWHRNEVGIGEEHFITQSTRRFALRLVDLAPHGEPVGKTALVAAVAGDAHELGQELVADALELAGWRVVRLGADVPPDELCACARRFAVDLVALSATLDSQRAAVADSVRALRAGGVTRPILVGGAAFASGDEGLWRRTGADGYAADALRAVAEAQRLLAS